MKKVRKISKELSHHALYYLCGGYDYRLENGVFTNCEAGRFDGARGEVIKKLSDDSSTHVHLTPDELNCYINWIGEAVSIKSEQIDEDGSWTQAKQNKLNRYYEYLNTNQ